MDLIFNKLRAEILNDFGKRNFGETLKRLENDPSFLKVEEHYNEFKKLYVTSNDPMVHLTVSFLAKFHDQFEINKQILRDCMNLDWSKETAFLEMKSMERCSEESMKRLYSLLEEFKEVMV